MKVSFNKLGVGQLSFPEPKTAKINDIEVTFYRQLPVKDKITLISNIVNNCIDESANYYNPCRFEIFSTIEIVKFYTNIKFTQTQLQDVYKLYDQIKLSGLLDYIECYISKEDYKFIMESALKVIKEIYKYRNSALGIFETVSKDYSNLELDAQKIQKDISDPNSLALLKQILTKLG